MRVRSLGLKAQEVEVGPFVFLLSDSIPVAFRDQYGGHYRSREFFTKGTTRHQNKWLAGVRAQKIPHQRIMELFQGVDQVEPDRRRMERRRTTPLAAAATSPSSFVGTRNSTPPPSPLGD